ncbi:MAG: glycosyltransferase family 4 protein [Promethearchaeota archaeon]
MKILIIYPHGNALNPHSGAEVRIWNLITALTNQKINISVLHSNKSKGFEDKNLKKKVKVYYYRELSLKGVPDWYISDLNPFFMLKLLKIIRRNKIDIIQVEFPWGFLIIKLLARKNTFLIYDSLGVESEFIKIAMKNPNFPLIFKPFAKILTRFYEKLVCKFANVIINVSNVDRNYYIKKYQIKKNKTILIQIPSSINIANKTYNKNLMIKCREKLNLPIDKTIVIFHGGILHPPNKEAFDLIDTFISPNIKDPNILFVIAGYKLEKFRKNNIISLGFIEKLEDLLYSANLAIVPIISGSGMRVKCIDYINTAIPFISTKKGIEGIDFLIPGEDYILCETVNSDFIKNINELCNNREKRENIHRNLLKKSNRINKKVIENRIIKLYLKLIDQNKK